MILFVVQAAFVLQIFILVVILWLYVLHLQEKAVMFMNKKKLVEKEVSFGQANCSLSLDA